MASSNTFKRELEVAFSKNAQPVWFRILKYLVLITLIFFFVKVLLFWVMLFIVFVLALSLHFWYRRKTNAWTKSYGGWDYIKNKPKETDNENQTKKPN